MAGSITGVPVIPMFGVMSVTSTSLLETGVIPRLGLMKLSCQSTPSCFGPAVGLVASSA